MTDVPKLGRVVLIDDNSTLLELLKEIVPVTGMDCTTYNSGDLAVSGLSDLFDELAGDPLDIAVILSDIRMPGSDGPTAVEQIFDLYDDHGQGVYKPEVRFMSGAYEVDQGKHALTLSGGEAILNKPFRAPVKVIRDTIEAAANKFYQRVNPY